MRLPTLDFVHVREHRTQSKLSTADLSKAGASQVPILALGQVHMDELAAARQLEVRSYCLGDVGAGDIGTDDQVARSHDCLPSC